MDFTGPLQTSVHDRLELMLMDFYQVYTGVVYVTIGITYVVMISLPGRRNIALLQNRGRSRHRPMAVFRGYVLGMRPTKKAAIKVKP